MHLLGIDVGSSSVKASLLDAQTQRVLGAGQYPDTEMPIDAPRPGWAEQDPRAWWDAAKHAVGRALDAAGADGGAVGAVGIAYQMHGLVCLDAAGEPLRPSIIWCDSRAVPVGDAAFEALGADACLPRLLNAPGNFTASKLAWVKQHEPDVFAKIDSVCLPGDYLAARMTGRVATTVSGLSEGILWDFAEDAVAGFLLDHFGVPASMLAEAVPTFGPQGELTADAAEALGLRPGTPVTYRAGDQPNNALSLNVMEAGEVAATAGTSGVVYGVSDAVQYDPQSRINTFAHVNHAPGSPDATRLGLLLCINGAGIANAWLRRTLGGDTDYPAMNTLAERAPIGADGVTFLPFGNGAERMLANRDLGAQIHGLSFNRHDRAHLCRAVQEGIVFAFHYGMGILRRTGLSPSVIRAGRANMFLSPLFRQALATLSGATIELFDTDGSVGAARGAGIGVGAYASPEEAFSGLERLETIEPDAAQAEVYHAAYAEWAAHLEQAIHDQR